MRAKPRDPCNPGNRRNGWGRTGQASAGLSAPWMARTSPHGWVYGVSRTGLPRPPARAKQSLSRGFARMARSYRICFRA